MTTPAGSINQTNTCAAAPIPHIRVTSGLGQLDAIGRHDKLPRIRRYQNVAQSHLLWAEDLCRHNDLQHQMRKFRGVQYKCSAHRGGQQAHRDGLRVLRRGVGDVEVGLQRPQQRQVDQLLQAEREVAVAHLYAQIS